MYQPQYRQKSIVEEYAWAIGGIAITIFLWLILNEPVMKLINAAVPLSAAQGVQLLGFIVLVWRIWPIGMVGGILVWMIMRGAKGKESLEWVGPYG